MYKKSIEQEFVIFLVKRQIRAHAFDFITVQTTGIIERCFIILRNMPGEEQIDRDEEQSDDLKSSPENVGGYKSST